MMTCRGLHVIRDLYSVCPIMASNTMTTVSAGIPQEMEDKFSKKGLAHIYRHTRDCTALLIYNDEVAWVYLEFLEEGEYMFRKICLLYPLMMRNCPDTTEYEITICHTSEK